MATEWTKTWEPMDRTINTATGESDRRAGGRTYIQKRGV